MKESNKMPQYFNIFCLINVINTEFLDNSHISEPALKLHSRAAPSVGGNITAQSILTQGEIPEEGRIFFCILGGMPIQFQNIERVTNMCECVKNRSKRTVKDQSSI